jgi:hypothetical protein
MYVCVCVCVCACVCRPNVVLSDKILQIYTLFVRGA